jgi:hypothetical protein
MAGGSGSVFRGLNFTDSADPTIQAVSQNVTVEGCAFHGAGPDLTRVKFGYGWVGGYLPAQRNLFADNDNSTTVVIISSSSNTNNLTAHVVNNIFGYSVEPSPHQNIPLLSSQSSLAALGIPFFLLLFEEC